MKKMAIYMSKLSIGGMEKSLINLLTKSDLLKFYQIDLYLVYNDEPNYLEEVPKEVNVHTVYKRKWNLLGKLIAGIKLGVMLLETKCGFYTYDASICYTHHHKILAQLTKNSSKNNICFIHADLASSRTTDELEKLMRKMRFDQFDKICCVSETAKTAFLKLYPNQKNVVAINNYIDGKDVIRKSKEKIVDITFLDIPTFINIARHEECCKKISYIIEASALLKKEGFSFRVLLIGDGIDHAYYFDLIAKKHLKENVLMLGAKMNPYPYLKGSDVFILSSQYEGYGIVLDEARVLKKPIITTDVGDAKKIVNDGYGILCEKSIDGIYMGMKEFLTNDFSLKVDFNYMEFNKNITKKINSLLEIE